MTSGDKLIDQRAAQSVTDSGECNGFAHFSTLQAALVFHDFVATLDWCFLCGDDYRLCVT